MSYTEHPYGLFRTVTNNGGSYSFSYDYIQPETLMPMDIAALQYLYGANTSYRSGKDVYTFDPATPFIKTIYDAGGVDTISVVNFTRGCTIDLRDGHFSSIRIPSDPLPTGYTELNPGIYDGTDNLGIAFDTVIENATGGLGADALTGNAVANVLNGGGAADTMTGGAGSDTYYVNHAGDRAIETDAVRATGGTDAVWCYLATYTLGTNIENGRILRTGNATLNGNALNNLLTSGSGDSVLRGAAGADTADYARAATAVTVTLALTTAQATGGSGTDTLTTIENLTGSAHNDQLTGNAAANTLNGGNGADTLAGGGGGDLLSGGAGADRLSGGGGVDVFLFNGLSDSDTITDFASASDRLRIAQGGIRVGDGDTQIEGATTIAGPGGFAAAAELVVVTADIGSGLGAANAAAAIGSASGAYAVGRTALFMVNDGASSALYRFTAANADAQVSAAELTLLATLSGTAATATADLIFTA
ncbi:MAG TPA: hypothetical protein VLI72_11075 [Methylibium sp.]|nr:hypothetical protein [Methylibium sp.]